MLELIFLYVFAAILDALNGDFEGLGKICEVVVCIAAFFFILWIFCEAPVVGVIILLILLVVLLGIAEAEREERENKKKK